MKFSIRDLLLVTVIVALALGWWIDYRRKAAEIKRLEREKNREAWRVEELVDFLRSDRTRVDITEDELTIDNRESSMLYRSIGRAKLRYEP
jgi:hypothetical protein